MMKLLIRRFSLLVPLAYLCLLIGIQGALAGTSAVAAPKPVKQADAVCSHCHKEIYETYLKTPMANASGIAMDLWLPGSFHQSPANVEYRFFQENEAAWMSYSRAGDSTLAGKYRLDYFLGSGHLGLTYLYSINGYLFETPAAYYAKLAGYDMKPGVTDGSRMPPGLPMDSGCLRCHMSAVRREDPGTKNHFTGLPFLHGGITCESCHGATEEHVATQGRAEVVNPVKLDAERRDSVCINCHLEGDTNVERRGRHAIDYRPGDRIADYLTFFQYTSADATTRGVSEIEQLDQSMCKRRSGDRMSCMSCHDPHFSPTVEKRVSFYRSKCLGCHVAPKYATAHFSSTPDCTSCHMRKNSAENIPHVAWTDHRILRQPAGPAVPRSNSGVLELSSILKGETSQRDMALAYYNLATTGHASERQRALESLQVAAKSNKDDPEVLLALGIMLQWSKNKSAAQDAYSRVLQLDPQNLTASVNLGTLMAQSGQMQAAADLWTRAFARNEDNVTLGTNLATVECLLGNKAEAGRTLTTVLTYNPDEQRALAKLRAMQSGEDSCKSSGSN